MSDSTGAPPSPPQRQRRRSFVEMLNPRAFSNASPPSTSPPSAVPTSASVPNNRKSMSMALGLSGAGNSPDSPYNAFTRQRRASISTSSASGSPEFRNSFDDGAVIEDDDKVGPMTTPPSPSFARRLSFGAQALRDVRQGGSSPGNSAGEGFNWSDAMRDKNKRSSISGANPFGANHSRSKSFTAPAPQPPKEMPQPARVASPPARAKKPDHLGERMLRGDFMMD